MRKTYRGKDVDVSFDPDVCVHSGKCVAGYPRCWSAKRRPWIEPDAATANDVAAQVKRCPSGALQFRRRA